MTHSSPHSRRRAPQPLCPLRPPEPCTACQPGTNGPEDCQLLALVMGDEELRAMLVEQRRRLRATDD